MDGFIAAKQVFDKDAFIRDWNSCIEINGATNSGATPAFMAVKRSNLDILQLLIDNGADTKSRLTLKGLEMTLLHVACRKGSLSII